jgi:hypothetical protein
VEEVWETDKRWPCTKEVKMKDRTVKQILREEVLVGSSVNGGDKGEEILLVDLCAYVFIYMYIYIYVYLYIYVYMK